MRRFALAAVMYLGVLALAAVAVTASESGTRPITPAPPAGSDDIELIAALEPFNDCDALLQYFKDEALERVGPYGLEGMGGYVAFADDVALLEGETEAAASAGTGGMPAPVAGTAEAPAARSDAVDFESRAADGTAFSGTNVQEGGVDEPDIVKTDGEILVILANERLRIYSVSATRLRRLGSLKVPGAWGNEILLDGDRVLILGNAQGDVIPMPMPAPADGASRAIAPVGGGAPISTFRMVDISDPISPELVSTLELDGEYVSARLVNGVARVVIRSQPSALPFVYPEAGGLRAEREARQHNREVVRDSTIDQWLPYSVVTDEPTGVEDEQSLLDCTAVHHPDQFAGFGLVSVLTVDLAQGLQTSGTAGVVGAAETVYASTDSLYVALNRWPDDPARESEQQSSTDLHQFDISADGAATYVASGTVSGRLLNQWAMSEYDGDLRVATTIDDFTGNGSSESAVVVLRAEDGALRRVGRLDGLGKTEQIYSVRFEGDTGYVVTFRQTDPLYTIDLSDPTAPRRLGELKIPGYSAYLHPVAEGRLLGVGQDATRDGMTTGSQVSLFDVRDLRAPQRLDQLDLGPGSSAVEYDHRAFTFWPATDTVILPLETWGKTPMTGAVVLRLKGDGITRQGRIRHPVRAAGGVECCYGGMITRSLVVGDGLVTLSDAGVMVSGLDDLQRRDWVRF